MTDQAHPASPPAPIPAHPSPAPDGGPGAPQELLSEDSVLYSLLKGIAQTSGDECFQALVRNLATAISVKYAVVAEFLSPPLTVRTLAFWGGTRFLDNVEYSVVGTPCESVIGGRFAHHPSGLCARFPADKPLVALGAESYLGVPLLDPAGGVLGHLFVLDTRPMPPVPRNLAVFRIFAARATTELLRRRAEEALRQSEERFRSVINASMDAVVAFDSSLRIAIFNSAAERIFRCTQADAVGAPITRFAPPALAAHLQRYAAESAPAHAGASHPLPAGLAARRADGEEFPIEGAVSFAAAGRSALVAITLRDIGEREQTRRRLEELRHENAYLKETAAGHAPGSEPDIVGKSPAIRKVLADIALVAPTDSNVIIMGETGSGKELIARAVHARSQRHDRPFIKVNCAALPAGLVESEFFGHEKGAFTGAVAARRGRFELANGGTIFLDEVGEVSPDVQVKLLRVLQEQEFERVGGSSTIKVDVRVIAATNRDLAADVDAGRFRADLYYRLGVFPISVPPLRDRPSDIPLLTGYFVTPIAAAMGKRIDRVDPETLSRLSRYPWPGNIRELRNVIERAVILTPDDEPVLRVDPSILLPRGAAPAASAPRAGSSLADVEREHIAAVLRQTGGAIAGPSGAAAILGLPPSTLRSKMAKLGIKA
ncbi:MAG: sigma 54-interacting transcriptional regulator [Phycisphaeraceae bacterium]|nr:sigma 54-interacting transcriptional regulator [Phycisphaeraceae bacterium]